MWVTNIKHLFLVKIKKGKIKETITTWMKEWEVTLEVEVTKKSNESLTNIVHFTTGDTGDTVWAVI